MTTVADYQDRTVDLSIFQGNFGAVGAPRPMIQALATGSNGGLLIAGVQKMAQRYFITLLTPSGSVLHRPTQGTRLFTDAARGVWRTELDVRQSFLSANTDALRQLRGLERATDPADERISRADLLGVQVEDGLARLRIRPVSAAGSGYTYLLPIATPIRR